MRICILQNSVDNFDDQVEFFKKLCPQHDFEKVVIEKKTAVKQIQHLKNRKDVGCFINFCSGSFDGEIPGLDVMKSLEMFHMPYTGARTEFFARTKEEMKLTSLMTGVPTPQFIFAYEEEAIENAAKNLKFPMIVKHYNGYSSISMTKKSKVNNKEELFEQATQMISEWGGALIEEFIEGREFIVIVTENPEDSHHPIVLQPVECTFEGENFKTFGLRKEAKIKWFPCTNPKLSTALCEYSRRIFTDIKGTGYGRLDWRVDSEGIPYFLEVNPNCGLFNAKEKYFGGGDWILKFEPKMGHAQFLEHIINLAIWHQNRKCTQVKYTPKGGFGVYATRLIKKGEIIQRGQEHSHCLITRSSVETSWEADKQLWFKKYSYPISPDVWVINNNLDEWKAVNHTIKPNAMLLKLDIVATKDIEKGEPISFF